MAGDLGAPRSSRADLYLGHFGRNATTSVSAKDVKRYLR
jgi:hypothetical protein